MRQELIDKLYNDFPKLFREDFDNFWIDQDGWFNLIYDLSSEINSIISLADNPENYYLIQVKCKFSGLRYYMSKTTKEMDDIISLFEIKSYNTCILCGKDKDISQHKKHTRFYDLCETCSSIQ